MEYFELIKKRYSVRKFTDEPVKQEEIDRILEASHIAPTGCNAQPQRILVMNTPEAIEKLQKCTRAHFGAKTAMLICYNKDECWTRRKYDGEQSGMVDASIVTTHMMLAAEDIGVGTTWVMHFDPFAMREEFNIPENIIPVALLVMGYPAPDATPHEFHSQFRPMDETVKYNSF
ncbi:MAG: nitroreductase [Ruminococcaceae bacterium]|nr:nitroreductase [Oscillospiraceae bacterium]